MSKLNKKIRKRERPAAIVKESTSVASRVPTKPRRKLITKKEANAARAKLNKAGVLLNAPKAKMLGSSGALGLISPGKILKGGKMVGKFIAKHLGKKGGAKVADKKLKG